MNLFMGIELSSTFLIILLLEYILLFGNLSPLS